MEKLHLEKDEVERAAMSLFPTHKATIDFHIFDRIMLLYMERAPAITEWAALNLVESRYQDLTESTCLFRTNTSEAHNTFEIHHSQHISTVAGFNLL